MRTQLEIKKILIDDAELIKKELISGKDWQITIYDAFNEKKQVGVFLEKISKGVGCTIMFDISPEQAIFLGNALISTAKCGQTKQE